MSKSTDLVCHPATPCVAITRIVVSVAQVLPGALTLRYAVTGNLAGVRVPEPQAAWRVDELWRRTCAELFVAGANSQSYCEFNFAPSTEWAAYEFTAYRQGMQAIVCAAPMIQVTHGEHELLMEVQVHLPAPLASHDSLQLGLTMVIEDMTGQCSYWALAHAAERPDFHHRDGFVLNL
jgi:hypothetical protein